MKRTTVIMAILFAGMAAYAQAPKDRKLVDRLCGCFSVDFKYAETFSPDRSYKFHEREEIGGVEELALPVEVSDKKIVIQHLLVVAPATIVKHWREEWTYENPVVWNYKGDRVWVKEKLNPAQVKGKWTQTVWEVSDEPRYQGVAQFIEIDGKMVWQSTADAPLPRREYSVRNDYNILKRTNRLNITDSGYVHEQDNQKIIRAAGLDRLLAEEKGINSYKRLDDKACAAAKAYWDANKDYWTRVRMVWDDYVSTHDRIELKAKVEDKQLNEFLVTLEKEYADKKIKATEIDARIKTTVDKFIVPDGNTVAGAKP